MEITTTTTTETQIGHRQGDLYMSATLVNYALEKLTLSISHSVTMENMALGSGLIGINRLRNLQMLVETMMSAIEECGKEQDEK